MRFFTSDLHISHRLVSGLRGFWMLDQDGIRVPDTNAHNQELADNWDAAVGPDDEVFILGDMSINSGTQVIRWIRERPGTVHLISGNHDKTHRLNGPMRSKSKTEEWAPYFASIQDELVIEIEGRKVTLSHFPYWSIGDGERARRNGYVSRYQEYRPKEDAETILLFGHIHDNVREVEGHRAYHVGLDGHGLELVPEETIASWVRTLD